MRDYKDWVEFCKKAHEGQFRKGSQRPYFEHLLDVEELMTYFHGRNHVASYIAMGHDLLEDTPLIMEDLVKELRHYQLVSNDKQLILSGILLLTDHFTSERFPSLNRKERKKLEAERLSMTPPLIQEIKCADILSNLRGLNDLDADFVKVYIEEKRHLLSVLNTNARLKHKCLYLLDFKFQ